MSNQKILRLILGDQLNENHSWFKTPDRDATYVLMEIRQETDYVKHHIQKAAAFFAAMRAFTERISQLGHHVTYLKLDDWYLGVYIDAVQWVELPNTRA